MIATDSSSLVAYFHGEAGPDIEHIVAALTAGDLVLPPVVVTEILSDAKPNSLLQPLIERIEMLPVTAGYWERAGGIRRQLKRLGVKAKIADVLIAQIAIDHNVALITRDMDFRPFAKHCGLKLA
jgi:predicted nucleic acid-binding protein